MARNEEFDPSLEKVISFDPSSLKYEKYIFLFFLYVANIYTYRNKKKRLDILQVDSKNIVIEYIQKVTI